MSKYVQKKSIQYSIQAFGWDVDKFIYYGGYPGAAPLISEPDRWIDYISGSIIDATINKDILVDVKVTKPALLRRTLEMSSAYSGKELSLTKMIRRLIILLRRIAGWPRLK